MPTISVITVCYNSEATIDQCISSIVNQSYADYEYIVVDGCSTDNTSDIINKYKNNIDTLIIENDETLYEAMNKGISASNGKYLLFINSDDYLIHENVLMDVAKHMVSISDHDLVVCKSNIRVNDNIIRDWIIPRSLIWAKTYDPHLPSTFINRSIFNELMFNPNSILGGDTEFFMELRKRGLFDLHIFDYVTTAFSMGGVSTNTNKQILYVLEKELFITKITGKFDYYRFNKHIIKAKLKTLLISILGEGFYYKSVLFNIYKYRIIKIKLKEYIGAIFNM